MSEIAEYIDMNHAGDISLEDIVFRFYLSREYFSRFYRKNIGITFIKFLNQARLMHVYQDICNTQMGILELVEKHGSTSYKVFNKMFHEVYGCAPREVRNNDNDVNAVLERIVKDEEYHIIMLQNLMDELEEGCSC